MKVTILYFNDRHIPARVFTNTFASTQVTLQPAQGELFTYDIPDDAIPFVKVWETGVVLLSYSDKNAWGGSDG